MRRKKFTFNFKFKKKHWNRLVWTASVIGAGYLLFLLTQPPPPVKRPPAAVAQVKTATKKLTPPEISRPKIAFVIDDIGGHDRLWKQLSALDSRTTYAVLPLLPFSKFFGQLGKKNRADVILHLPLDTTVQDVIPGPGLLVSPMSDDDVIEMLRRNLDSVPNRIGVNNHCGSRGTADPRLMKIIFQELKRQNLFFLDSYTTRDSVVPQIAHEVGIPFATRGSFLDNSNEIPDILKAIKLLEHIAKTKGTAIAIGHYRENTLKVLRKEIPRLERAGFQIVRLRELIKKS